jgi:hypothetical protein
VILDRQGGVWRATFTSSMSGVPRVEVFHHLHHRALEIAHTCRASVERKHPADFPAQQRSAADIVRDTALGLAGVIFIGAQVVVGLAAVKAI